MRVQPDGRAAYCAQAFTLEAPPGISVVLGAYPESVARRAFVLRDSAASPAARESWFDPALVCAGPDVAGGTTCSWGPGQEEVIFVPLQATRGVLVNIPEPRALETDYFAYWAEPPWASGEVCGVSTCSGILHPRFPLPGSPPFEFFNLPNSPNRLHVSRLSNFSAQVPATFG